MQQVTDMLTQIAPFMDYAVYAGWVFLALGLLALAIRFFCGACVGLLKWTSRLMMLTGVIFLAYQIALIMAGTSPNGGAALSPSPLWTAALVMLVPGYLLRLVASLKPAR